jgi:hypothetical protein
MIHINRNIAIYKLISCNSIIELCNSNTFNPTKFTKWVLPKPKPTRIKL